MSWLGNVHADPEVGTMEEDAIDGQTGHVASELDGKGAWFMEQSGNQCGFWKDFLESSSASEEYRQSEDIEEVSV